MCSSSVLEYTRILSRYATTVLSRCALRTLLINSQYVAGAFVRPNGITRYSYSLYRVLNAVFYSLPFFMRIRLYAPLRSNAVKYQAPASRSCSSVMFGSRYKFLIVILLSFLKLMQGCSLLSFFRTNIIGYPAGDSDHLINPFLRFSVMYSYSTLSSALDR